MSSMFWGLRLEPGKRYSTTVKKSFHVSMAALDFNSVKNDDVCSVMLEEQKSNASFILCNLHKNGSLQCPLDLNFMSGNRVTFFCKGSGVIHLSGYLVLEEEEEDELENEEVDDEEEVEVEEDEDDEVDDNVAEALKKLNGQILKKRKSLEKQKQQISKKKKEGPKDESDDESDDVSMDDLDLSDLVGLDGEEDGSDEEESDGEGDEEESDADSDSPVAGKQANKKQQKNLQQNTTPTNKQNKQKQQKTPNGQTPESKKGAQKQQGQNQEKKGESPGSAQKQQNKNDLSAPQQKKVIEGGVQIKDLKQGNGPPCKSGKVVHVYYVGRFKNNNKIFDSSTTGAGFKFRVGKGEVIKGWDVGVVGMKVGGKRVITCPPHMAYGPKGSPPTIPPNSSLVFEVELKAVN